ncbi:TLR21 protein, partial [Prunella himalayana]|nr:TLR21 protein [Prunella himalayana]
TWQVLAIYVVLAANLSEQQVLKQACPSCDASQLCSCSSIGLDFIPLGLTAKITVLNLSHNRIKRIQSQDLQQAVNLRALLLQSNKISSIDEDSFQSLEKLELLDLSNNSLAHLSPLWFRHLFSLQHLHLQGNSYRDLGQSSLFSSLRNLSSLYLGNPQFSVIRQGNFEGIELLHKLWIDGSNLSQYEQGSLKSIKQINHMIINLRNSNIFSELVRDLVHSVTWLEVTEIKLPMEQKSLVQNSTRPFRIQKLTFKEALFTDQTISRTIVSLKEITSLKELEGINCVLEGKGRWNTKEIARSEQSFVETVTIIEATIQNFHLFFDLEGMESQINKLKRLTITSSNVFMVPCKLARHFSSLLYLDFHDNLLVNKRLDETICERSWPSLQTLNLSQNSLKSLEQTAKYISRLPKLNNLDISQNNFGEIPDVCEWPKLLKYLNLSSTQIPKVTNCIPRTLEYHVVWYLRMTWAWLQAKRKPKRAPPKDVCYDAFVSYSENDSEWVENTMVRELEQACPPFRLCLHKRDFVPGKWIVDNIIDSIEKSRKTLFVLSEHFVQSEWCKYELDFSHFRLFDENNDAAILVLLEPIQSKAIPKRFCKLRKIMNTKTYLEWPAGEEQQQVFWENLKGALKS